MRELKNILLDYLRAQNEVILYGCGYNGKLLQWILDENDVHISFWCDRNPDFTGKKINNVECLSPDMLEQHSDAILIVDILKYKEVLPVLEPYKLKKILTWDDVSFLQEELFYEQERLRKYRKWRLQQAPELWEQLKKNERFKNIHKGKRCFIIGNGPSVKEQDLSLLRNEITFTVNQMARNPQFEEIDTNYHVWADERFFKTELTCEGDYELLRIMKQMPKDAECFFLYNNSNAYIKKFGLDQEIHVNYYNPGAVNEDEEVDFTDYIRGGATVVQNAIRLALYMGMAEIYLLGCECTAIVNVINARTSQYSTATHCYDIDEKEKERAKTMYFSMSMQMQYDAERRVLDEYHALGEYCKNRGIKLINCTPGGLLDEIPRARYEDVVKGR